MRNRSRLGGSLLALIALSSACTSSMPKPLSSSGISASTQRADAAHRYLVHALDIIESEAIEGAQVDWPKIRAEAEERARNAKTTKQDYSAIDFVLRQLHVRGHSYLVTPDGVSSSAAAPQELPAASRLARLTYFSVPSTVVFHGDQAYVAYMRTIRYAIRAGVARQSCGWLIDLRGNHGGDVWPMYLATQPLLGSGTVGYFNRRDGSRSAIRLTPTSAALGSHVVIKLSEPSATGRVTAPVALLTGPYTASAGEALDIAFHGRAAVKSFGGPTSGHDTANSTYRFSDGAELVLSVALESDRTGHLYADAPLRPDVIVANGLTSASASIADATIQQASSWLQAQPSCRVR